MPYNIDARIPLIPQAPQMASPMQSLQDVFQMQKLVDAQQERKSVAQREAAVRQLAQQYGQDPETLIQKLREAGELELAIKLQEQVVKDRQAQATLQKTDVETAAKVGEETRAQAKFPYEQQEARTKTWKSFAGQLIGVPSDARVSQLQDWAAQGFISNADAGRLMSATDEQLQQWAGVKPEKESRPYNEVEYFNSLSPEDKQTYLAGKRQIGEAGRAPSITVNTGGAGTPGDLTPEGIEFAATQYRITGQMPPLGMGKNPARAQIINAAARQANELKQTPAAAIQKQAAYKADTTALAQMQKMRAGAEAFETKAVQQAEIIREISAKVSRTQWPIINRAIQSGRVNLLGDKNAQLLANAITTFSAEYAKIIEGSTGSVAGSSDSARRASERLVNPALNKGTMAATLDLMQREMDLTLQGYDAAIAHITERMGGAPAAPAAPKVETWVRDPKTGRLVKQ